MARVRTLLLQQGQVASTAERKNLDSDASSADPEARFFATPTRRVSFMVGGGSQMNVRHGLIASPGSDTNLELESGWRLKQLGGSVMIHAQSRR